MTANNDKNRTYSVFYIPKVTGMHKVIFFEFLRYAVLLVAPFEDVFAHRYMSSPWYPS